MTAKKRASKARLTTVRLRESTAVALERRAKAEGIGRSELIRRFLEAGLERAAGPDRLAAVEKELRALRREVKGLAGGGRRGRG